MPPAPASVRDWASNRVAQLIARSSTRAREKLSEAIGIADGVWCVVCGRRRRKRAVLRGLRLEGLAFRRDQIDTATMGWLMNTAEAHTIQASAQYPQDRIRITRESCVAEAKPSAISTHVKLEASTPYYLRVECIDLEDKIDVI